MENKITAIVVTYKPDDEKMKRTLTSIFNQKDIGYEILICDDGTPNYDFDSIKAWIKDRNSNDIPVKYVLKKENKGIINNIIDGVKEVKTKYIKIISPGDYLNTDHALFDFVNKMEKEGLSLAFCDAIYFNVSDKLNLVNLKAPLKNIYGKKKAFNKLIRHQILYQDNILGASMAYEAKSFLSFLEELNDGGIKFDETLCIYLYILHGYQIGYINKYLFWYEYGTGLSTQSNSSTSIFANDEKNMKKNVLIKYKSNALVKKILDYFEYKKSHSKFKSYLYLFIKSPITCIKYMYWLMTYRFVRNRKIKYQYEKEDYSIIFESKI